tara:strand:+ start:2687 stop:4300 length:1614 start_codon:yes stop_codon:yes gene_type:complete
LGLFFVGVVSASNYYTFYDDGAAVQNAVNSANLQSWAATDKGLSFESFQVSDLDKQKLEDALSVYFRNNKAIIFLSNNASDEDIILSVDVNQFLIGKHLANGNVIFQVSELADGDFREALKRFDSYFESGCSDIVPYIGIETSGDYTQLYSDAGKVTIHVLAGAYPSSLDLVGTKIFVTANGNTYTKIEYYDFQPNWERVFTFENSAFKGVTNAKIEIAPVIREGITEQICEVAASIQVTADTEGLCTDSDGRDEFTAGNVYAAEKTYPSLKQTFHDVCVDTNPLGGQVLEYLCGSDGYLDKEYIDCSSGCGGGKCIRSGELEPEAGDNMDLCLDDPDDYWDQKTDRCYSGYSEGAIKSLCSDPDGGRDFFEQAHTFGFRRYSSADDPSRDLRIRTGGKDACLQGNELVEHYCDEEGYIQTTHLECEFGCGEGVCLGTGEVIEVEEGEKPVKIPESDKVNKVMYTCMGCELDNKCYPMMYRKKSNYCSEDLEWAEQKQAEENCDNNFECDSNVCIDSECVSAGLLKRILNWFRKLFG